MKTNCLHGIYILVEEADNKQDKVCCISVVISVKEKQRVGEGDGDMEQMICFVISNGQGSLP